MTAAVSNTTPDPVIPAALVAAVALILPPLQLQAWWLILPCLICLILRWQVPAFVLLFAAMTYADSWLAGSYFLALSLLLLMRLHSDSGAGARRRFYAALRQLLLALPILVAIMLLLMAAGARWSDRSAPDRAGSGISESMTPGSVSELVNDRSLAMRVRFDANADRLRPQDLYWRGLVLEDFDGRTWSRNYGSVLDLEPVPASVNAQQRLRYQVTLEPTGQAWLFGLHQAYTERPQTYRDNRGMLLTTDLLRQRVGYPVTSIVPPAQQLLDPQSRQRNLALPVASNPQTREWVDTLRSRHPDDRAFTEAVLQHFSGEAFVYTLTPALTSEHGVDDFLFATRQGFCEHYAGALAFVLRAAGIPSRIVLGYQGGDFNAVSDHWTVYQLNAHAWVEAWFPDAGWQRLDPTARIAPERIELGIHAWLAGLDEGARNQLPRAIRLRLQLTALPGYQLSRNTLDALQFGWNQAMYDHEGALRSDVVNRWLEERGLGTLPLWLLTSLLVLVALRAGLSGRQRRTKLSPALREYRRLEARLRRKGLGRRPSETINAHLLRVGTYCPEADAAYWRALAVQLTAAEYGREQNRDGGNIF